MLDETKLLNSTNQGWKKHNGYFVCTDKDVAPANILKVVKCR